MAMAHAPQGASVMVCLAWISVGFVTAMASAMACLALTFLGFVMAIAMVIAKCKFRPRARVVIHCHVAGDRVEVGPCDGGAKAMLNPCLAGPCSCGDAC